jgi:hypothetical protein
MSSEAWCHVTVSEMSEARCHITVYMIIEAGCHVTASMIIEARSHVAISEISVARRHHEVDIYEVELAYQRAVAHLHRLENGEQVAYKDRNKLGLEAHPTGVPITR